MMISEGEVTFPPPAGFFILTLGDQPVKCCNWFEHGHEFQSNEVLLIYGYHPAVEASCNLDLLSNSSVHSSNTELSIVVSPSKSIESLHVFSAGERFFKATAAKNLSPAGEQPTQT